MEKMLNEYLQFSRIAPMLEIGTDFSIEEKHKSIAFSDKGISKIENILKKFKDPRIYFVINCHAKSSPNLLNFAFKSYEIDNQLDAATKLFINDNSKNKLRKNQLELSNRWEEALTIKQWIEDIWQEIEHEE